MNGNNYQIKASRKEGESYFGYAETRQEAEEIIEALKTRPENQNFEEWQIISLKPSKAKR